ncbi:MAG: hypothetical protein ABI175_14335, partial [Polyangiales bacterium]
SLPATRSSAHPFRDQHLLLADAQLWHERGVLAWHNARHVEAEAALARAFVLRNENLGPDHPETLETLERQAACARSVPKLEAVIARLIGVFGVQHVRVAIARRNLAADLRNASRLREARALLGLAGPVIEGALPAGHADVVALLKVDALLNLYEKRYEPALALASRAIELGQGLWPEAHPFLASAELTVLHVELATKNYKSAHRRFPSILGRLEAAFGAHPLVAITLWLGARIDLEGEYGLLQAEGDMVRAIEMVRAVHEETAHLELTLFEVLYRTGRVLDAEKVAHVLYDRVDRPDQKMVASWLARRFRERDPRRFAVWQRRAEDDRDT